MSKSAVSLQDLLQEKIVIFDGAMGTSLQKRRLTAEDFGGLDYEGCNENLVLTRPDVIEDVHRAYLEAGADVLETNTFGGTRLVLSEYHLQDQADLINQTAARLARKVADEFSTSDKPRFVAGSMGPTTKSISVTGGVTFMELVENFYAQAKALLEGGVDLILMETCQDTRNIKAGILGLERAKKELGVDIPLMISGTIEPMGTMLAGQTVEALYASVEHADPLAIGLNCATGPQFMTDHIRSLSEIAVCYTSAIPNAGLPDEEGRYNETPDMIASALEEFIQEGWVNILGGCCGTTPEHIAAIVRAAEGKAPRRPVKQARWHVSGIDYLEFTGDNRPVIVGERTNVIGSRMFKRLISEEKYEEASEIGRRQVRTGAQIVDVCLANPDRDEKTDMDRFLAILMKKIKAPLMIDSTDPEVIELALQYSQGKAVINSINLEDGEKRFAEVVPLAKQYGAALIVGCIDDDPKQGMALTVSRKVEIARRAYDLLTNKYGYPAHNIIFDPLVFPCATGDENYIGSAEQTILGVKAIKEALPLARTVLGVSNVSFGLPPAGREVLNAVFLYHCTKAGLDLAIVNPQKMERYASIPEEERRMAEDLLFNRGADPIGVFAAFYKEKKVVQEEKPKDNLSVEERLASCIVEGSKDGLIEALDEALKSHSPLEIINGPLMGGMDEVGRLFGANELIVAEVLQSAEVMKAAVSHLEPLMEKSDANRKGVMVLATVKGDVHDIGKNLVEIIFSNNGYKIVNLGIKVPPEELIRACREHRPSIIGLSGLLVKSAQQMVVTANDLRKAGITSPLMVGGAALSNRFTRLKIAPQYEGLVIYAKDAMNGLDLANQLTNEKQRPDLEKSLQAQTEKLSVLSHEKEEREASRAPRQRSAIIAADNDIPSPPDFKHHTLSHYSLEEIYPYLNLQTLMGKHLGLKGRVEALLAAQDEKALSLTASVRRIQEEVIEKDIINPRAVFQFFPVRREDDAILILNPSRVNEIERFAFPRQSSGDRLCLADFISADRSDNLAMFVSTCGGRELTDLAERCKRDGEYLKSHILQALAIECAEAFAELLHEKIRRMWGIIDPPDMTLKEKLHAKYRGIRVSPGYPACPRLEDQAPIFKLLKVEESIGAALTDGYMMEPEASVSAIVFHHPDAKYFNVGDADLAAFEKRLEEKVAAGAAG
ncbi:MAG: methionine synthase [Candidatus Omnitrophica bacterium]|nr:methionine synthase [Candidatus Omnitrophota bacterium]